MSLNVNRLLKDHFIGIPGLFPAIVGNDLIISWISVQSQFDGSPSLDSARDTLIIRYVKEMGTRVRIYRVDCAERILYPDPWKILSIHNPALIPQLNQMVSNL